MAMNQYKVEFTVNGRRTETIVSASDAFYARKLVEAQYSGNRVTIIRVTRVQ